MDGADGITVRHYREEDLDEAVALLERAFGAWPGRDLGVSPADHLRWKLNSHPQAPLGQFVAEADGRLVGTHFCFVQAAVLDGREVIATCGTDSSVHPDYRERHVYTAMREARYRVLEERFDLRFSRGAHVAVNRARDRRGEPPWGDTVEILELPFRRFGAITERVLSAGRGRGRGPSVEAIRRFEPAVDDLWARAAPGFAFGVARTRDRLDWRYADTLGGRAEIRVVRDRDRWRGYVVLRWNGTGGLLSDVLVAPGDGEALGALLDAVRNVGRERRLRALRAWMPTRHPYRAAFLEAGFRPTGQAVDLRYAPLKAESDAVARLGDASAVFHITMGDTDAG